MSEQEKKSGAAAAGGSSVVMVEQSAASRHKQPYRPTDLKEDAPELHHKRSKAPAVPSVTEEFKDSAENPETIERKDCERATENHKHNAAKKLSTNTSRRESSPETIALAPVEVEKKKASISPQPIPAQVGPKQDKVESENKGDDDSITEEIGELRTPEVAKKESEWEGENKNKDDVLVQSQDKASAAVIQSDSTNKSWKDNEEEDIRFPGSVPGPSAFHKYNTPIADPRFFKKKEITWYDGSYLPKEHNIQELGSRSRAWMLERKVSVGPCLGTGTPFGGEPSGITICVPKKSLRNLNDNKPSQSGICITVSKKCLDKPTKSGIDFILRSGGDRVKLPSKGKTDLKIDELPIKCLDNLKGKLDNMYGKIKNVLHI